MRVRWSFPELHPSLLSIYSNPSVTTPPDTCPTQPNHSKRSNLNFLYFSFLRRSIHFTSFFGTSEWQHACFKWENGAGDWKLYINGEVIQSGTGFQIGKVPTLRSALFSTFFCVQFHFRCQRRSRHFALLVVIMVGLAAVNCSKAVRNYPPDKSLSSV